MGELRSHPQFSTGRLRHRQAVSYNQAMLQTIDMDAIRKLSTAERLKLLDMIWQSLADDDAAGPFPPEVDAEMERRAALARANPDEGMSLEEFDRRLEQRRQSLK
jgi:putative addiction module component (TIGR02574 family)